MRSRQLKIVAALVAIAALIVASRLLPIAEWLLAAVVPLREAGAAGAAVFFAVYVVASVVLLPASVLTVAAGTAYGLLGTAVVWPAALVAVGLSHWLGRTAARGWIARRVAGSPRFQAIDEAVADDALKIVLLLRLSPLVPFNILNYSLGLTRVRIRDNLLASALGILPGTFLYVYLGTLVTDLAALSAGEKPDSGIVGTIAFWGGLLATLAVTVIITRAARAKLREHIATDGPPGGLS